MALRTWTASEAPLSTVPVSTLLMAPCTVPHALNVMVFVPYKAPLTRSDRPLLVSVVETHESIKFVAVPAMLTCAPACVRKLELARKVTVSDVTAAANAKLPELALPVFVTVDSLTLMMVVDAGC